MDTEFAAATIGRMPDTFELETRDGFRTVEFDPDAIRYRDVRVLVDGKRVGEAKFPKAATPYHEIPFDLSGHAMVGVVHLSAEPSSVESIGLRFDLYADGRSLTDGSPLAEARAKAPAPGKAYPQRFRIIDMVLQIAPTVSAPGLSMGVVRRAGDLGWPTVAGVIGLMLGAVVVATWLSASAWQRIRRDERQSVGRRAALGTAVVVGCYVVAFAGVLGVAYVIGLQNR